MADAASTRTIAPEGELDLFSVRGLASDLSAAVGDITRDPVVDLTGVTFMDSTALGVLAKANEQLRRQGRSLALLLAPGQVSDLLDLTGLRDRFAVLNPAGR
jgi:anti-sigma B factor antagonist